MASQVDVFNRALVIIGEKRVSSPSEDTKAARELSAIWDTTREGLLRAYRWSFAMKRAQLAPLATPPAWGFSLQFPLPSDFLRLDQAGDFFVGLSTADYVGASEAAYAIERSTSGRVILTDMQNPLNIRYVSNVTVPTEFDPLFTEALAAKLGLDAGAALTDSSSKVEKAERAFERAIAAAIRVNAIERPPETQPDGAWVAARL